MMRNLLIETQSSKPAPCQMHAQFLDQFALTGDAKEIADQENAQHKLRINRWSARLAVAFLQLLSHEGKADVLFDEPQQVGFRNLIFQTEVVAAILIFP